MPTKKTILQMFLEGKNQEEILKNLREKEKKNKRRVKDKKLQTQIRENAFLSPKNFKYGSFLIFFTAYFSPVFAVYMRGYEFEVLVKPIFVLSLILSIPFFIFAVYFYLTKDLRKMNVLAMAFLAYYIVYMITFTSVAIDVHVWTVILFPLLLMPTMFIEWLKLQNLLREIHRFKNTKTERAKKRKSKKRSSKKA